MWVRPPPPASCSHWVARITSGVLPAAFAGIVLELCSFSTQTVGQRPEGAARRRIPGYTEPGARVGDDRGITTALPSLPTAAGGSSDDEQLRAAPGNASRTRSVIVRVVRRVWLATACFLFAIVGVGLLLGFGPNLAFQVAAPAVLVVPVLWWWIVRRMQNIRVGSGAVAGALIVPIVWILNLTTWHVMTRAYRGPDWHPNEAVNDFGTMLEVWFGLVGSCIGSAAGAAFGALIAWGEKWILRPPNLPPVNSR